MAPVQEREEVSKFHLLQSACVSFLFYLWLPRIGKPSVVDDVSVRQAALQVCGQIFAVFMVRKFPHRMDSFRIELGVRVSVLAHWC